jgi:NAD(P)-dependent dehydrogenase (short-subunit alcohol dehydrogenase family)
VTKYFSDLAGTFPSMNGKTVAITCRTSDMGLVLAQTCAWLGAKVAMLNRPSCS